MVIRQILTCSDDDASAIKNSIPKNYRQLSPVRAATSRSITRGNRKFPVAMFTRVSSAYVNVAFAREQICQRNNAERETFEHYLTQRKTEEPSTVYVVPR